MKAVKKLLTCVLSATLLFGSATSVFAADSKTAAEVKSETTGITVASDVSTVVSSIEKTDKQAADVITKTQQDPSTLVANLKNADSQGAKEAAQKLEGKTILTPFFDIENSGDAVKGSDGKYSVTLSVPELTNEVQSVQILHYSTERGVWEVIDATFDLNAKTITGKFQDLSPATIAVVLKTKSSAGTAANAAQTTAKTAAATTATAPVTGVSTNYVAWLVAALALAAAGAVMFRRKKA